MSIPRQDNLSAAIDLAKQGRKVFPCRDGDKPKRPIVPWTTQASSVLSLVEHYWTKYPSALVGLPTGRINGITVLDVDKKNGVDGFASLAKLGVDLDSLKCPKVKTPTGGLHVYFLYTPGIKNSAGKIGPGLDIRNDGGYVIAAGEIVGLGRYEVVS